MKFIYAALVALTLTSVANANEVNFINAGSEDGVFKQMLDMVGTTVDHNFVQANTPINAATYFGDTAAFTVWSSEWPSNPEFQSPVIDENNLVALLTYDTMMCSREFKTIEGMAGKEVKIATWGSVAAARFLEKFGQEHDINFIVVPYEGSGATTKGYIAQDADTIFTIVSKQAAVEEDINSKCFAFSVDNELGFKFVDAMITVNADPDLTTLLRETVTTVSTTPEWTDAFSGSVTYITTKENAVDLLNTYSATVVNFSQ